MTLHEINEAVTVVVEAAGRDANVIFGAVIDETIGDAMSITVIATGFGKGDLKVKPAEAARISAATAPTRIYELERERVARPAITIRPTLEEEEPAIEEPIEREPMTARPATFRVAQGTARRPFGGRALTKDNMDVPAFMRKQMD